MIEKITDQNLERYDSRLKEWCDRKFFEKDNYGKYQTTEEAGAVVFYPAPNTPLEGKVKFSFKETMPTNGDKGPDNLSTITGISSITVTHCETEGVDSTDYTIQLGNTYYGGEIDLATGLMTVTHVHVAFTGAEQDLNWGRQEKTNTAVFNTSGIAWLARLPKPKNPAAGPACTHFPFLYNASSDTVHFYVFSSGHVTFYYPDPSFTAEDWKSYLAAQYATGTPVTVCYEAEVPLGTVQLTPTQILSLAQTDKYTPRLNTVYTDANSVQISYLKSPIRDEYEKTQAILSLGGNS